MNPRCENILKISLGEFALDGISGISLLNIFLINQRFALNLTGNPLLASWLETLLSQLGKDIFHGFLNGSISIPANMSKGEWEASRGLADDRSISIKQEDKGSCVVVWCRDDYIKEANKQLKDKTIYKDVNLKETILSDLVHKSNRIFKSLYTRKFITEKKLKYFS